MLLGGFNFGGFQDVFLKVCGILFSRKAVILLSYLHKGRATHVQKQTFQVSQTPFMCMYVSVCRCICMYMYVCFALFFSVIS